MSEHHRGAWGARDDAMWWPGAIATDQSNLQQHHQHLLQQQQQLAAAAAAAAASQQQQQQQSQQQQQQQNHHDAANSSASAAHQLFSYKMASSFQNPATTVSLSNVSPTSPVGAAGIRGYDYRLGGGMTGGNPTMSAPAPAAQWWYPPVSMDNMHTSLQNSMQQSLQNQQAQQQNMPPVQTPPPAQSDAQVRQDEAQRQQEVHRQQQEAAQRQEVHRQHQEAQRHHQEAQRQHQEAQRQQVEAQQAAIQHHQALADQVRHQQQLQAQQRHHLQQQVQQQVQNNHHQQTTQHQSVLQQQQISTVLAPATKGRMPRGKADARPRGRMTAYAFFVQTCREEHKKKHPEENVVFAEFSKKCAERWKTMSDKEKKRFHEMAENDKKRYDAEMQNYTPPKGEKQRGKKRKQIKDPNAPKRSLSAFFWFSNDERGKVKAQNPEYGVGDIAKELGRRWADADPEAKGKYEALADQDKARYEKEMTAYKKKNNPAMQQQMQQQAPVPDDVDEDEEEGDDDEDE